MVAPHIISSPQITLRPPLILHQPPHQPLPLILRLIPLRIVPIIPVGNLHRPITLSSQVLSYTLPFAIPYFYSYSNPYSYPSPYPQSYPYSCSCSFSLSFPCPYSCLYSYPISCSITSMHVQHCPKKYPLIRYPQSQKKK